jgi:selT/selW/selH-like putative selenoprotein
LAADIERKTGVKAKLVKGRNGVFDVAVDGKRIFSKREAGRFPEHAEVLTKISEIASEHTG